MKIDFKKIVCFGLAVSFGCLSAQETQAEANREISMARTQDGCEAPEDCRGDKLGIECHRRMDDADYDVYTIGGDKREECEKSPSPCKRKSDQERGKRKSNCGNDCKRRGAAKAAQD